MGGAALGPGLLAACGDDAGRATLGDAGKKQSGGGGNTLNVSTWITYIDTEPAGEDTLSRFTASSGIQVNWNEDINDNNEYFAKIQPEMSAGKAIAADVFMPTYWLVPRLVRLGWLQKLPLDEVPNATNLIPGLKNPKWDPGGEYSLPWQSFITGIAYNRKAAGREIRSVNDLFDPAFKGKIGMLTEMRDTIGLLMLADGKDPSQPTFAEAQGAFARLEQAKHDGQIRKFTGNDYQDDLIAGSFTACIGWSGDLAQLALENPDLAFTIPEEGGLRSADTMVMPVGAANVNAAARFMDFVYNPANAARITAAISFVSPVAGVQDELRKMGGAAAQLADSPLLFPDETTSARLEVFGDLSEEEEARFDEAFSEIAGA
jgi:spermidine/putrescine transport system substrate-binding protein